MTSEYGEVHIVDPVTHRTVGDPYRWGATQLEQAVVSAGGLIVAALSNDRSLRLWDGPSRLPLFPTLKAHSHGTFYGLADR